MSILQQKIDEHVNDPEMPRYMISLSNVDGEAYLPKGVHLYLNDCRDIKITGGDGDNLLFVDNALSILVQNLEGARITLQKCPSGLVQNVKSSILKFVEMTLSTVSIEECQVDTYETTISTYTHEKGTLYSYENDWVVASFEGVEGSVTKGKSQVLTVKDKSSLSFESHDALQVTTEESYLSLYKTDVKATLSSTKSTTHLRDLKMLSTVSVSGGEVEWRDTQALSSVTMTGSGGYFESHNSVGSFSSSGNVNSVFKSSDFVGSFTLSGGQVACDDVMFTANMSMTGVQGLLKDVTCVATASTTGTLTVRESTFASTYSHSGGQLDIRKSTIGGSFSASGLAGRNVVAKVQSVSASITGNGSSHADIAESTFGGGLTTSAFGELSVTNVSGASVNVSGSAHVELKNVGGVISLNNIGVGVVSSSGPFTLNGGAVLCSGSIPTSVTGGVAVVGTPAGGLIRANPALILEATSITLSATSMVSVLAPVVSVVGMANVNISSPISVAIASAAVVALAAPSVTANGVMIP